MSFTPSSSILDYLFIDAPLFTISKNHINKMQEFFCSLCIVKIFRRFKSTRPLGEDINVAFSFGPQGDKASSVLGLLRLQQISIKQASLKMLMISATPHNGTSAHPPIIIRLNHNQYGFHFLTCIILTRSSADSTKQVYTSTRCNLIVYFEKKISVIRK